MLEERIVNSRTHYDTWNTFKKDLELNLGHFLPNDEWLRSKPKKPLPWFNTDMKETFWSVLEERNRRSSN